MARVRSPNFPVMSLPDALQRVERIHDKEQHLPCSKEVMAEHLGYSGLNGAALKAISALTKYGLLESVGDSQFRVSTLAMRILFPHNDDDKQDAIYLAATSPALFEKFHKQWDGEIPSDANFKNFLIRSGFAQSAIPKVISAYKETMELVNSGELAYSKEKAAEENQEKPKESKDVHVRPGVGTAIASGTNPRLAHVISRMKETRNDMAHAAVSTDGVSLTLAGNSISLMGTLLTRSKVDDLVKQLEALKPFLAEKEPQSAEKEESEEEHD